MHYKYVIVGGGLTAASAVEGIRAHDREGSILLVSRENYPPYHRPPLSKDLWFGKTTLDKLSVHEESFYRDQHVELSLRREIVELDPERRTIWDERGVSSEYERLLLATGGRPRALAVEGADVEGIRYFRSLEDYLLLRSRLERFQHALVLGGGFIAMELAAALKHAGKEVTLAYPHEYPLQRALPRDLGLFVADYYRQKGIETVSNDLVTAFEDQSGLIVARTRQGNSITTQLVVVGIGIEPQVELAEAAGLAVGNGIEVDEHARTSDPHIYAAGDVAEFPYLALGARRRIEHWDHAQQHGRAAGASMAGAAEPYVAMPMFFSDFFELGWEAVGDLDSSLDIEEAWNVPHREGVVFYLRDDVIRGVLLWNVWNKVEWARGLIKEGRTLTGEVRAEAAAAGVSPGPA
jgi:NADPH-dependent 2,4-dienoyl-CoA reductase/sulfur reductase-like enzyme